MKKAFLMGVFVSSLFTASSAFAECDWECVQYRPEDGHCQIYIWKCDKGPETIEGPQSGAAPIYIPAALLESIKALEEERSNEEAAK